MMFGFCPTSIPCRDTGWVCRAGALTMGIHLLAGAVFCSWFDLCVTPFICCFLLFVIVVVLLCCPEVQASVQDFVRDGKRNCLLLTSEMPVMSKVCPSALRFLSLLLVPVLGAGLGGSSVSAPGVALCHSGLWLHLPSVLPCCPLLAAPQFPGEQHLGKEGRFLGY